MTYSFTTTPAAAIARFWERIRLARQGGPATDAAVRRALIDLVELACLRGQTPPADPEVYRQFHQASAEALLEFPKKLGAYANITLVIAEGAREDDWYELCMRRSVIQVLWDDYAGTPVAALISPADVADLDAELRRVGAEYGPVPPRFVPSGLPASHWWWRYPLTDTDTNTTA